MNKDAVIALLTVTINRYSDINAERIHVPNIIKDLNLILDYVVDAPVIKPINVIVNKDEAEIGKLKKRVRELEETCIENNTIIDSQFKKILKFQRELSRGNSNG